MKRAGACSAGSFCPEGDILQIGRTEADHRTISEQGTGSGARNWRAGMLGVPVVSSNGLGKPIGALRYPWACRAAVTVGIEGAGLSSRGERLKEEKIEAPDWRDLEDSSAQ